MLRDVPTDFEPFGREPVGLDIARDLPVGNIVAVALLVGDVHPDHVGLFSRPDVGS
jgi:hypothetical protein